MTQTILYQDQEYSVYGWQHALHEVLGKATFSCPITLPVGSPFTLKASGEIFKITEVRTNTHKAQKIGNTEKTPKAIFPTC